MSKAFRVKSWPTSQVTGQPGRTRAEGPGSAASVALPENCPPAGVPGGTPGALAPSANGCNDPAVLALNLHEPGREEQLPLCLYGRNALETHLFLPVITRLCSCFIL